MRLPPPRLALALALAGVAAASAGAQSTPAVGPLADGPGAPTDFSTPDDDDDDDPFGLSLESLPPPPPEPLFPEPSAEADPVVEEPSHPGFWTDDDLADPDDGAPDPSLFDDGARYGDPAGADPAAFPEVGFADDPPEAPPLPADGGEPLPADGAPAGPPGLTFLLEILVGGSGNLWSSAEGGDLMWSVSGRPSFLWPWGFWAHFEIGQHHGSASRDGVEVSIDAAPFRLGAGWVLGVEPVELRIGLQGIAERWWTGGGISASGWRSGAGLLVGVSYRLGDCCVVGAEVGADLMPRAVRVDWRDEHLFALGQIRWHAAAWLGFDVGRL